ncbi:uncharacterized protein LOC132035055 [Lycium ferocissimum]|uniref:uncharacterized protein LOC132035055 n=1 Tax=Lycium ferocissimum TaxID=112874 RepID=UPI002814A33A|nr:uncharacterized protein LOC132035055 [Lycium ferocissimum]
MAQRLGGFPVPEGSPRPVVVVNHAVGVESAKARSLGDSSKKRPRHHGGYSGFSYRAGAQGGAQSGYGGSHQSRGGHQSGRGGSQASRGGAQSGQSGHGGGLWYSFLGRPEAEASNAVISGNVSVDHRPSSVLFDPGTFSYVSTYYSVGWDLTSDRLDVPVHLSTLSKQLD